MPYSLHTQRPELDQPSIMPKSSSTCPTHMGYPYAGLHGKSHEESGHLIDCYVDVKVDGFQSQVASRTLFQNSTINNIENAKFVARVAEGALVTSIECFVERCDGQATSRRNNLNSRLERRAVKNVTHEGSFFSCNLGRIERNRDVVVFLKYEHDAILDNDTATIHFPLPGSIGERMITRQGNGKMEWNGSHMFSFIAIDFDIHMPGSIHKISSSTHSITALVSDDQAKVEVDNHILLGQDDFALTFEADNLDLIEANSYHLEPKVSMSQVSLQSDATIESVGCLTPAEWENLKENGGDIDIFEKYFEERGIIGLEDSSIILEHDSVQIKDENFTLDSVNFKTRFDGRAMSTFFFDDDEEEEAMEEEIDFQGYSHDLPFRHNTPCSSYFDDHNSWYEEDSDAENEGRTFLDSDEENNDEFFDIDDESDDEWDTDPVQMTTAILQPTTATSTESYFDSVFLGTALAVSPGRPKIICISPRQSEVDEKETPPSSPITRELQTPTFGLTIYNQQLDTIISCLTTQIKQSSTIFLSLDEDLADIIQVPLENLINHPGTQANTLPRVSKWIREGMWANVITLHFLQSELDCRDLAENDAWLKGKLDWLICCLENPLLLHEMRFSGSLSLSELLEMAKELFAKPEPAQDTISKHSSLQVNTTDLGVYTPPHSPIALVNCQ